MAVHCLYPHALGGGPFQSLGELWMGAAVGGEIADALHLDDEQHTGPEALLLAADQLPQVFDPPLGGGVREEGHPILLQGDALHLHEPPFPRGLHVEVEPGAAPGAFPQVGGEAREQLGQLSARLQRTGEPDGKEDAHVERTSL